MEDPQTLGNYFNSYRIEVGLVVPLLTLLIGMVGKKILKGPGWQPLDANVGAELSLAGVSGAIVNLFDLSKPEKAIGVLEKRLLHGNILLALLGIVFFCVALSFVQDFTPKSGKPEFKKQLIWLTIVSNAIGLATLIGAVMSMAP
jgi:hypothetical protein